MSDDAIRKENSLGTSAARLHADFKESHSRYNDLVGDLALLTKSELRPIMDALRETSEVNGIHKDVNDVFGKIENVLFDMTDSHSAMDEIVQTIGGLEFSSANTVDKFSQILKDQEQQQSRMTQEINLMREEFNESVENGSFSSNEFIENINEFEIDFSRFQDHIQESVPRVSRLFDELDDEEERGKKFGKTNKI
ncbi:MAG: hypothetical protein ACXAE3_16380 [Candidatus Kariarchaeaceae archaeon]|jgi:methyl-accepting chemotaxis protein